MQLLWKEEGGKRGRSTRTRIKKKKDQVERRKTVFFNFFLHDFGFCMKREKERRRAD